MCFYVGTIQIIYLSNDDIYSDSTVLLGLTLVVYLTILMFVLTLADGLCCDWFVYRILCWCRCPEIGTSSIDWAQLSRFHLKTETESSFGNVVF
jgi:hypothetical protein